jgi:transposase
MLGRRDEQSDFLDEYVYGHLIPAGHILVKIKENVDFSFIEEETEDLYSPDQGRPAYPAETMFRMLFLEFYYNLSDVEVCRQCQYNVLYRWFVGLGIEEKLPDDTSLVVFRRRLGAERFEKIFDRVVELAKEAGLLRERYKIVDATSVVADVAIPNTVNLLRQGRRVILREIAKTDVGAAAGLNQYKSKEKLAEKPRQEDLLEEIDKSKAFIEAVKGRYGDEVDAMVEALDGIVRPRQGQAKVVSFVDFQARHGMKSRKAMFSGYKAHIAEDESEIVTSCDVLSGNRNEGHELPHLLGLERAKRIKAQAVVADSLYDSGDNRECIHQQGMKAYIPFRRERKWTERFAYLPGEDRVICAMGQKSIGKSPQARGNLHYFSTRDCGACSQVGRCLSEDQPRMKIWISDS